jgi:hypothetical protein
MFIFLSADSITRILVKTRSFLDAPAYVEHRSPSDAGKQKSHRLKWATAFLLKLNSGFLILDFEPKRMVREISQCWLTNSEDIEAELV